MSTEFWLKSPLLFGLGLLMWYGLYRLGVAIVGLVW